jgi:hypothetical protein
MLESIVSDHIVSQPAFPSSGHRWYPATPPYVAFTHCWASSTLSSTMGLLPGTPAGSAGKMVD